MQRILVSERNTANNESGQVAFRAGIVSGGDALLIGMNRTTTVATTSGPFFTFDALSINDSGQVAFSAMNDDGSFGVYFLQRFEHLNDCYHQLLFPVRQRESPVIQAWWRFTRKWPNSIDQGIFYGPNPAVNKLIRVGDNLDGGIVGNIAFSPFGLNNNNQFAFTAKRRERYRHVPRDRCSRTRHHCISVLDRCRCRERYAGEHVRSSSD